MLIIKASLRTFFPLPTLISELIILYGGPLGEIITCCPLIHKSALPKRSASLLWGSGSFIGTMGWRPIMLLHSWGWLLSPSLQRHNGLGTSPPVLNINLISFISRQLIVQACTGRNVYQHKLHFQDGNILFFTEKHKGA